MIIFKRRNKDICSKTALILPICELVGVNSNVRISCNLVQADATGRKNSPTWEYYDLMTMKNNAKDVLSQVLCRASFLIIGQTFWKKKKLEFVMRLGKNKCRFMEINEKTRVLGLHSGRITLPLYISDTKISRETQLGF